MLKSRPDDVPRARRATMSRLENYRTSPGNPSHCGDLDDFHYNRPPDLLVHQRCFAIGKDATIQGNGPQIRFPPIEPTRNHFVTSSTGGKCSLALSRDSGRTAAGTFLLYI